MYEHRINTGKDLHGMVLVLPQATVVSLGVDPMLLDLDLDIGLYSTILYLNLLETLDRTLLTQDKPK